MLFNQPIAWILTALALPVVIFYVMKIRLRKVRVSTVMFWEEAVEERQQRSLWQTLRDFRSLLLQLAFLFLLVAATADPGLSRKHGETTVFVLDISASMQAENDPGVSRFEAACRQLRNTILSFRTQDQAALVTAGPMASVACGLTSYQRMLLDRLNEVTVTDSPCDINTALKVAERLLASQSNGRIVVLSDRSFAESDVESHSAGEFPVQFVQFGQSRDNIGVTEFQVRRSPVVPSSYQVLVEVRSFSDQPTACSLELSLENQLLDVIPLSLSPNESWKRVLDQNSIHGGVLKVQLLTEDGLESDNTAVAWLPERPQIPVTLATSGNWFLEQVLEANDSVRLQTVSEVPLSVKEGEILIIHDLPVPSVPSGNVIVIDPVGSCALWKTEPRDEPPLIGEQDGDHELMRFVVLDNVLLSPSANLMAAQSCHHLIDSASGDLLYGLFDEEQHRVLVLSVGLNSGDLPLRTAFPILLSNALTFLSGTTSNLMPAYATGDSPQLELSERTRSELLDVRDGVELLTPNGERRSVAMEQNLLHTGPLLQAGVYRVLAHSSEASPSMDLNFAPIVLTCNLTNPAESDLRRANAATPLSSMDQAVSSAGFRPLRTWLILAALLWTVSEWCMYQRRWTA